MGITDKFGLGTVQWGIPYGVANQHGITAPETVAAILVEAARYGIKVLDTASLYGNAETVLGYNQLQNFHVVTKTPKFATAVITDKQADSLAETARQSLQRLGCDHIYGLLIHHAEDLIVPGGEKLVAAMMALKEKGQVGKIGVSIYNGEQIDAVLTRFKPDIVQLPISVFDQRMLLGGQLKRLKEEGVEVHARSVFLQGLLLMSLDQVPPFFEPIRPLLNRWHAAAEAQHMTPVQAALSYVREIPYIDTVLVGVESLAQFQSCIADFSVDIRFDATGLACNDPLFVNPASWRL